MITVLAKSQNGDDNGSSTTCDNGIRGLRSLTLLHGHVLCIFSPVCHLNYTLNQLLHYKCTTMEETAILSHVFMIQIKAVFTMKMTMTMRKELL